MSQRFWYGATVLKVIDGDTIVVDIDLGFDVKLANQKVRLLGVDTPESRTSDKVEKAFGEAPGALIAIGLMTDTDNTRSQAQAWYGTIQLK